VSTKASKGARAAGPAPLVPIPPPEETPVGKRFATWLYTVRTAKEIHQHVLADQVGVSRSWMCLLDNGKTLPTTQVAQRLAQVLEDDPFRVVEALEADRKYLQREYAKKPRGKGMRLSKDEREAHGRDVRLALLRAMAARIVRHGGHASLAALARDVDLSDKSVRKHLGQLEAAGFVVRASLETEVALYHLTPDGLERALERGWQLPPLAEADATWRLIAESVLGHAPRIAPAWADGTVAPSPPTSSLVTLQKDLQERGALPPLPRPPASEAGQTPSRPAPVFLSPPTALSPALPVPEGIGKSLPASPPPDPLPSEHPAPPPPLPLPHADASAGPPLDPPFDPDGADADWGFVFAEETRATNGP